MSRPFAAAICSSEWVDWPMIACVPEHRPRVLDRGVVLADVDPVGVAGARQVGVVVDDEERRVVVGEATEGDAGAFDLRPPELLLAQLDDVDAAAERGAQQRFGIDAVGARVADEVEARGAQPLAQQRALALGRRKAHPSIMAAARRSE